MSTVQLCIIGGGTIPITGYGVDDSMTANTTGTQYSGSCYPHVSVSGGSGSLTFSWSFTTNAYTCTLTNPTSQQCTVSHTISKYGFDGSAVLQCVINDTSGQSLTISNIKAVFSST